MIHVLYKKGYSIRAISRITGIDRKTVTKRLKQAELSPIVRINKKQSKLEPYKEYILKRISKLEARIPSGVILDEIKEHGYNGSLRILQEFLTLEYNKRQKPDPVVRFETAPGHQAQVDWTTVRGGRNKIYAFVMTLGYSRSSFVWFTEDMESPTLIDCHHRAFSYFGGVTKTILYDNMKTAVDTRNAYGEGQHKYHARLLDLSKAYGFEIKLCKPYRPRTKGKVERFNSYLKANFYRPLVAKLSDTPIKVNAEILNTYIFNWLNMANSRIHGTTGKQPCELLKAEITYLLDYIKPVEPKQISKTKLQQQLNLNDIPVVPIQQPALHVYDTLVV